MRAVVQRVSRARVTVRGDVVGSIPQGFVVLLGVEDGDTVRDVEYMARKIAGLRVFEDEQGRMNLCLNDVNGRVLVVSQFTLLGDCRKGRRPSFVAAAEPELADQLYEELCKALREQGVPVETGRFRQHMDVELINDGPVTLLLDSRKLF